MRFSFRIKYFIILLAFSLGPMLISRGLMGQQAAEMSKEISADTRQEMLEIIRADLKNNASGFLNYLDVRGQSMALTVRLLAQQAEVQLLMEKAPESEKLHYSSNFTPTLLAPMDTTLSNHYERRIGHNQTRFIPVSMEHLAFRLLRTEEANLPYEQALRVNKLLPSMQYAYRELELKRPWFNIGLESGLFATYPGHGFYPPRYDHRNQRWYLDARQAKEDVVWTTPVIDPATRQVVVTVSYPIRGMNREFLGAVSIDVPVASIIQEVSLKSRWSEQIESFMVKYAPPSDARDARLLILAKESYDEVSPGHRHWESHIEAEVMTSDDPEALQEFIKAVTSQASGVSNLPYKGKDSLWAYASNENISFLLIAPDTVVAALPDAMADTVELLSDEIRNISAIVSGIVLILVGIIAWFGSKRITRPLLLMADATKRLAGGDTSVRMELRTGDERDQLIDAFNDMVPKLQEHIRMSRDFELAHEVQKLLLPRAVPCLSGYDISGGIVYCDQTGGDYYDFIPEAKDSGKALGVVLGDVSGHGISSALLMATARGQLHSLSQSSLPPRERIQAINNVLSEDMDGTGRFLTLFYLRLRADNPKVRWVRAGHDPAICYNPTTDEFGELNGQGLALGVLGDFEFEDYEATLAPGEFVVLTTDGVWEARNDEGEMFGKERMLAIIRENAHMNAEGVRKALMNAVAHYQGDGQEDDIAVVVIRKHKDMTDNTISFRMTNKENCFQCFKPKVEAFGADHNLSQKVIFHLTLVLDELVTNIINYGYADFDVHPIDVSLTIEGDILTLRIEDDAEPFNILEAPEPELDVPLDERHKPIGGMGVHLVKSMVHLISYERKDDKNILTLIKDLTKHCTPDDCQA